MPLLACKVSHSHSVGESGRSILYCETIRLFIAETTDEMSPHSAVTQLLYLTLVYVCLELLRQVFVVSSNVYGIRLLFSNNAHLSLLDFNAMEVGVI